MTLANPVSPDLKRHLRTLKRRRSSQPVSVGLSVQKS